AFKKLGVECANWPEQVHSDIKGAADEEKNVAFVYCSTHTLNMMLFSATYILLQLQLVCCQQNAIGEFLMSKSLPLIYGLQDFQTSTSF
ncbi:unnamed protein product, partial [Brassica rapa subsp. trilocularis]